MAECDRPSVHVHEFPFEPQQSFHGEVLRREGLVHLDQVQVGQPDPGALERQRQCLDRPDPHAGRVDADERIPSHTTHWAESQLARPFRRHDERRRRTITQGTTVSRRDGAFLLEEGWIQRKLLLVQSDIGPFILGKHDRSHLSAGDHLGDRDRHGLVLEPILPQGLEGAPVAFHRKAVLLLATDAELLGQVFGRPTHELTADGIGQAFPDAVDELRMA